MKNKAGFVIVLDTDNNGPIYLGLLDCGRQGVRRIENAIVYKISGRALLVANDYNGAKVEPKR